MGTSSMTRHRDFSIVITESGNLRAKHDKGYQFWRMVTRENPQPSFDEAKQIINDLYNRANGYLVNENDPCCTGDLI